MVDSAGKMRVADTDAGAGDSTDDAASSRKNNVT